MTDEASFPNLRHLQVFCAVAHCRSMTAAAEIVPLSQSAITQAIAGLERYFSAALFKRGNTGMELTAAGKLCLARTERALELLSAPVDELAPRARPWPARVSAAQLQALLAIVEHGGFSAAARGIGCSRPTIHRAARTAEAALEVPLFESTSFGIRPTRAAQLIARSARLALCELQQARADADAGAGGVTVIGAMPLARSVLLPRALSEFALRAPRHRVTILEGTYPSLLASLRSGQIDWLIGALREQAAPADVVEQHLFDDPLAIIMRAGHPLTRRTRSSVQQLARFPWITPLQGSPLRLHFETLFSIAGIAVPEAVIECNSLMTARALLMESDRLMLLSAQQIYYERQAGQLVARPHPQGRVLRRIGLTYRRNWQPTAVQRALLEELQRQAQALDASCDDIGQHRKPDARRTLRADSRHRGTPG